jgi:translation initiation factor 2 beta subunit (eIF-2beta)/eIF-5
MVAPNPLAARRRTNSSSFSVAVPSSWEESVVSGAIAKRFAISRPLLNRKGDQTTIDQTSDIPQAGQHRMEARSLQLDKASPEADVSNR